MTHLEKLAALRGAGCAIIRHGSLGVTVQCEQIIYLPWRRVMPWLGLRRPRAPCRAAVERDTLNRLAAREPEAWEARRREYLRETGKPRDTRGQRHIL